MNLKDRITELIITAQSTACSDDSIRARSVIVDRIMELIEQEKTKQPSAQNVKLEYSIEHKARQDRQYGRNAHGFKDKLIATSFFNNFSAKHLGGDLVGVRLVEIRRKILKTVRKRKFKINDVIKITRVYLPGICLFGQAKIIKIASNGGYEFVGIGELREGPIEDHKDGIIAKTLCIKQGYIQIPVEDASGLMGWHEYKETGLKSFSGTI